MSCLLRPELEGHALSHAARRLEPDGSELAFEEFSIRFTVAFSMSYSACSSMSLVGMITGICAVRQELPFSNNSELAMWRT
jgi:hypothetical protein